MIDISQDAGIVFNIQKYSVHDGPGIRTIAFLKGCPLSCRWCSNPESQDPQPQLAYNRTKCLTITECGHCMDVCSAGAITMDAEGRILINRDVCIGCMHCADACPSQAIIVHGKTMTVDEVLRVVEQDSVFYSRSGGGLTLSGGEPMAQPGFAVALLREARARRLGTAMETAGHCPYGALAAACGYLDHLLFDIKSLDSDRHEAMTGCANTRILENIRRVRADFPSLAITIRTPVIPGFNDTEEDIRGIAALARAIGAEYEILPYHRMGEPKYAYLGRTWLMPAGGLDGAAFKRLKVVAREAGAVASSADMP